MQIALTYEHYLCLEVMATWAANFIYTFALIFQNPFIIIRFE